jgi:hypothetical protein
VRRRGERKTKQKAEIRKQKAASQRRRRSHLRTAGLVAVGLLITLGKSRKQIPESRYHGIKTETLKS